jgi:hypothetical protein
VTDQSSTEDWDKLGYTEISVLPDGRKMYTNPATGRWVMDRDPNLPPGWPATIPADWIYDEVEECYYPPIPPVDEEVQERLRREDEEFQQYLAELRRNPPKKEIIKVDWSLYQSPPQKASSKKTPPPRKTDGQLSLFGEDDAPPSGDAGDE